MGKLQFYSNLQDKQNYFNASNTQYFKIDNAFQFVDWYKEMVQFSVTTPFDNFFRGVSEARFKLYNSSQRYWIQNSLIQLESLSASIPYISMLQNMVDKAGENKLLQQVFEYYMIEKEQMDIPLLSILQHYAAPTPLMDWTYNIDIALFFASDNPERCEEEDKIQDYVSVYRINKTEHNSFVLNNLNYISPNVFPKITKLAEYLGNKVVYISDFEISEFENRKIKPLTTYYNLNILAQKGIFIFNPNDSLPLEEIANINSYPGIDNKIHCYNISKDLIELIKLKIGKNKIDESFIYPDLKKYAGKILNDYLQEIVQ